MLDIRFRHYELIVGTIVMQQQPCRGVFMASAVDEDIAALAELKVAAQTGNAAKVRLVIVR